MKKVFFVIAILALTIFLITGCEKKNNDSNKFRIVTSFYPMYIMTQNIAGEIEEVSIDNMTQYNVGCLHDYTLKTSDLKKIENANAFVANGLGIENFINKITETYSNVDVIIASDNIKDLIEEDNETNAHIWLSTNKYISEVDNIKNKLASLDVNNSEKYNKNAEEYKKRIRDVKEKIANSNLKNKKCISFSESLAYLKEDFNLDIFTIETDHEQNGLSAETLSNVIEYVKSNNIKSILVDSQTAQNNAKTVANETGAKVYVLNSGLNGENSKNAYIEAMEENLKIVESME